MSEEENSNKFKVDLALARLERDTQIHELNQEADEISRMMTPEIIERTLNNILGPRDAFLAVELLYCGGTISALVRDFMLESLWNGPR